MHPLEVLADPVRRRLVALLAHGEAPAGALADAVIAEFGISQPAVSQHLRVLREGGFAISRAEGNRRLYRLDPSGVDAARAAIDALTAVPGRGIGGLGAAEAGIGQALDALHTEVARGKRARRTEVTPGSATVQPATTPSQEAS